MRNKIIIIFSLVAFLGCASTPEQFRRNPYSLSNANVCRTYRDAQSSHNYAFANEVWAEISRRGLDEAKCQSEMNKQVATGVAALAAVALVAAAVSEANSGSGGGGGSYYTEQKTDYDWAWDQFYDQNYNLVWRCRGKQTGQFAENSHCLYKSRIDNTWPAK